MTALICCDKLFTLCHGYKGQNGEPLKITTHKNEYLEMYNALGTYQ